MTVFRNLLIAKSAAKRPYYCEVEYIESTGTQWIDTGYIQKVNPKITSEFAVTSGLDLDIFGNQSATASCFIVDFYVNLKNNLYYRYSNVSSKVLSNAITLDHFDTWAFSEKVVRNGTVIHEVKNNINFSSNQQNIFLFRGRTLGHAKIKYVKIEDNNTLVRDFIPVLDWNMVPCMYDKVSGELFYNQGTGDFIAGRQIHPVEYLESTGTQYIDTGVLNKSTVSGKIKYRIFTPTNYQTIIGGRTNTTDMWEVVSGALGTYFQFGNSFQNINEQLNNINLEITNAKLTNLDTGEVLFDYGTKSFSGTYPIYLFANDKAGVVDRATTGVIFYTQLYDNDILVRDFIPAIDENGVGFMFDRVTHTIYDNAGAGTFGYNPVELEYIETDGTSYINTGYTPSGSTETEITTMLKDQTAPRFMFGCRTSQSNNTYACLAHNQNRIGYRVGATGGYFYSNGYNELNVKHTYKIANGVFYRDGEVVDTTCEGATTSPNSPLALLTINTNNVLDVYQTFVGNFYSCTMKENNTLVRDFIPCYKDGVVGMWDKVNEVFYANAGTGDFVVGPIKEER